MGEAPRATIGGALPRGRLALAQLPLTGLLRLVKGTVSPRATDQLGVGTLVDDRPVFNDIDPVSVADGAQPMGNDDSGSPSEQLLKGLLDQKSR